MKKINFKHICDMCGNEYQQGDGLYEGRRLDTYDIIVCNTCARGNQDGWPPSEEEKLIKFLKQKNLPIPPRNQNGLLPLGD